MVELLINVVALLPPSEPFIFIGSWGIKCVCVRVVLRQEFCPGGGDSLLPAATVWISHTPCPPLALFKMLLGHPNFNGIHQCEAGDGRNGWARGLSGQGGWWTGKRQAQRHEANRSDGSPSLVLLPLHAELWARIQGCCTCPVQLLGPPPQSAGHPLLWLHQCRRSGVGPQFFAHFSGHRLQGTQWRLAPE